jgi:hypothetical protein
MLGRRRGEKKRKREDDKQRRRDIEEREASGDTCRIDSRCTSRMR